MGSERGCPSPRFVPDEAPLGGGPVRGLPRTPESIDRSGYGQGGTHPLRALMFESSVVVFLARFGGTAHTPCPLSPRRDPRHLRAKAKCWYPSHIDEHQSRFGSVLCATPEHPPGGSSSQPLIPFQRPHSSFFWLKPSRFRTRLMVESLRLLPVSSAPKSGASQRRWPPGVFVCTSSSRSLCVVSGPPFRGPAASPSWLERGPSTSEPCVAFD